MNIKEQISALVKEDLKNQKLVIKTVVFQDMIWPGIVECRAFASNGEVFSCMYECGEKKGTFVMVPKEQK